ncbi:MAG: ABC transporter ATP-binding protein [Candidatus Saccharibacteria bacterium]
MNKTIIRYFIKAAWEYPYRTSAALINSGLTVLVSSFVGPLIISIFLSRLQSGTLGTLSNNYALVLAYLVSQLYGELIGWRINLYMIWTMETAAQRNLSKTIFYKLSNQTLDFHANRFGGSLVSQTNKFIGAFERFWDTIIFQLVPSFVSIIVAVVVLSIVFWQYAIVLGLVAVTFIATVLIGSKKMYGFYTKEAQASTRNTGRLADVISNISAIKSYGNEKYESVQYNNLLTNWRKKSLKSMHGFLRVSSKYTSLIVALNTLALTMTIWASSRRVIPLGIAYLCITYTLNMSRQLWEMNSILKNYHRVMGDAYDMAQILETKNSIVEEKNAKQLTSGNGTVDFVGTTFSHNSGNKNILFENLNIHIGAGQKIGLVGRSGSGKTTLTKLLLRFMDIQGGKIMINGYDIKEVTLKSLRDAVAYVPQEPLLFHRTLSENISYGKLDATPEEIIAVAKKAHAHEFISELSDGYDTLVGERGVKLSGGQRQRVAIARAMLKDAPILVLDEATSALDSESEALIQDALWKLMEGRTALVIAHRLSTIAHMDHIIVLEKGKILEEGSHSDLIQIKDGLYAKLWTQQSGGFLNE